VIAMAGDTIEMPTGSILMIHDPPGATMGTAQDHRQTVGALDKIAESIAAIYAARTGLPVSDILTMMDAETWFNPDEAVELGFATSARRRPNRQRRSITPSTPTPLTFS
jgi:ATP-dependent protease ClpP protease subunit